LESQHEYNISYSVQVLKDRYRGASPRSLPFQSIRKAYFRQFGFHPEYLFDDQLSKSQKEDIKEDILCRFDLPLDGMWPYDPIEQQKIRRRLFSLGIVCD